MPIDELSSVVRLPRMGKIRLGIKVVPEDPNKASYPKAVDYFVVPEEIQAVYGEKPKELDIMFPVQDPDVFAPQWYKRYSFTQGLVCKGDGRFCRRKVDLKTGGFADHNTEEWDFRGKLQPGAEDKDILPCSGEECSEYETKRCRRVMNLQIVLYKVPGLGVWQLDTSSANSIININSMVKLIKSTFGGRVAMIPLKLFVAWEEKQPKGKTKKHVPILYCKQMATVEHLLRAAQSASPSALLEEPEEDIPPDDLYPPEILAEQEQEQGQATVIEQEQATVIDVAPTDAPADPGLLDQEWKRVRNLQKELDLPDEVIKSAIRLEHPNLKEVVKGVLPETLPPWLTLEIAISLRERLENTVKAREKPRGQGEAPQPEDNIQARRIAGWALIREIQKKLDMDDTFLKSSFKTQFPGLVGQIPRSAFTDAVPDWVTLEQVMAMARRLEEYQKKVAELSALELGAAPTEEKETSSICSDCGRSFSHDSQDIVMRCLECRAKAEQAAPGDHPWEQTKRGEDIEPPLGPPAGEPSTGEIDS